MCAASSVISSQGPSHAAKEHEKRILENILPPDLRHLIRGGSAQSIQVSNVFLKVLSSEMDPAEIIFIEETCAEIFRKSARVPFCESPSNIFDFL
jgi:hypothetical protein